MNLADAGVCGRTKLERESKSAGSAMSKDIRLEGDFEEVACDKDRRSALRRATQEDFRWKVEVNKKMYGSNLLLFPNSIGESR